MVVVVRCRDSTWGGGGLPVGKRAVWDTVRLGCVEPLLSLAFHQRKGSEGERQVCWHSLRCTLAGIYSHR